MISPVSVMLGSLCEKVTDGALSRPSRRTMISSAPIEQQPILLKLDQVAAIFCNEPKTTFWIRTKVNLHSRLGIATKCFELGHQARLFVNLGEILAIQFPDLMRVDGLKSARGRKLNTQDHFIQRWILKISDPDVSFHIIPVFPRRCHSRTNSRGESRVRKLCHRQTVW